jgi:putative endonuclease
MYYVYILSSWTRTLYVGVTNDLELRLAQHRDRTSSSGFTHRYRVDRLVYFECTPNVRAAIAREKQIKAWRRSKKVDLISANNPEWRDLSEQWR